MRIIVTGASGFIGGALCKALSAAGHVPVPASLRSGTAAFEQAQAVVHLAGIAHRAGVDRRELRRVNVDLSERVGRAATAAGARLIYLSSAKVHGDESDAALREDAPIAPQDAYAESKAAAEQALRAVPGLRLVVLRPPLVYGPAVKANFLGLLRVIDRGLPLPFAGISNRRSLLFVGNLTDIILRCLADSAADGRSYVLSDGSAVSTPELCRGLAAALGRRARLFALPEALLALLPGTRPLRCSFEIDDTALRRDLDWHPPFTLEQGLAATSRWYRDR